MTVVVSITLLSCSSNRGAVSRVATALRTNNYDALVGNFCAESQFARLSSSELQSSVNGSLRQLEVSDIKSVSTRRGSKDLGVIGFSAQYSTEGKTRILVQVKVERNLLCPAGNKFFDDIRLE